MIKEGGFKDHHMSWKNKIQYEKYMQMEKDAEIPEFCPGGVPAVKISQANYGNDETKIGNSMDD